MLRRMLTARYLAFTVLMVVVAGICIALGTWQVARFAQKRAENGELRANYHRSSAPLDSLLATGTSVAAGHAARHSRFRVATASGTYDPSGQILVRGRSVGNDDAYLVVTPLRTAGGVLLVLRGWVPDTSDTSPTVTAPPTGTVTVRARLETAESQSDHFGREPSGQVRSINVTDAGDRLGFPVYDGFGQLLADQPGTTGLRVMPAPDLSNPAGGAVEPQHLAYIAQWFLFALLALAAPPVMVHAESRHADGEPGTARRRARAVRPRADRLDLDEPVGDPVLAGGLSPATAGQDRPGTAAPDPDHRARMADRYGTTRRI